MYGCVMQPDLESKAQKMDTIVNTNGKGQYIPTRELAPSMRALAATLDDLHRRFGETAVIRLGESRHLFYLDNA